MSCQHSASSLWTHLSGEICGPNQHCGESSNCHFYCLKVNPALINQEVEDLLFSAHFAMLMHRSPLNRINNEEQMDQDR
jgi:hypothetical protein